MVTNFFGSGLGSEIRQAGRHLWKRSLSSGIIVMTLAVGIGANATMASLVWNVLLRP